ncbi:MAG: oxygen-independent coproporphyrinogen III oxidase [Stappia sp.]|uniref:oxygen-independent coproporphyrinogen III oxidase n=1 Tax=Stappia sp. TaxID=1870903 RepID=UPI000C502490|nr:oxygen-independent coproporphyrinogen III oxidase [Stappia sp.]MAB00486.1 oxygen-independent coproporphyrinogen III oxidase [Stappia sp.]MBM18598.1 oxygen-independent coproporphyrinogen III oxidase [Stappia sp.]
MSTIDDRYATRAVPRYTSYPTAPHFHAGVNAETLGGWLSDLPRDMELSLYLHVPYCRSICNYCGCHTKGARRDDPVIAYALKLAREVALVADRLGDRRSVSHIHWGGGTPSLLPRESFLDIVRVLRERFDFTEGHEHAIELDPRTVTPELAGTLREAGITRASLGVQDFDHTVQKAIGRIQPFEQVASAVGALRAVGIDAINFDLMYGLPHQTLDTIAETIRLTRELRPGRIALFGYAHVPWFKKHQRLIDEKSLPDADARIAAADFARARLAEAGYTAIGLDHFALPDDSMAIAYADGTLRRNFQGYTTDTADALIGMGCSSIGRLPQGFVQNMPDIGGWGRAVDAGELPVARGIALDADDRCRAEIIERLMTDHRADVAEIAARHGFPLSQFATAFAQLEEMVADGLVRRRGGLVEVSEAGQRYARVAAAAFDAYLERGTARHSVAV